MHSEKDYYRNIAVWLEKNSYYTGRACMHWTAVHKKERILLEISPLRMRLSYLGAVFINMII